MDFDYIKILVTVILAVLGWLTAHRFALGRTLAAKRRDVILEHLIKSYRVLTTEIAHRELDVERSHQLENLLSDIQLFGSRKQVQLAQRLADEVAAGRSFELDQLINDLRDNLRSELQLDHIAENVKWLRFTPDQPGNSRRSGIA